MGLATAIAIGLASFVLGIVCSYHLACIDVTTQVEADLMGGSVEIAGSRYFVRAIQYPDDLIGLPVTDKVTKAKAVITSVSFDLYGDGFEPDAPQVQSAQSADIFLGRN